MTFCDPSPNQKPCKTTWDWAKCHRSSCAQRTLKFLSVLKAPQRCVGTKNPIVKFKSHNSDWTTSDSKNLHLWNLMRSSTGQQRSLSPMQSHQSSSICTFCSTVRTFSTHKLHSQKLSHTSSAAQTHCGSFCTNQPKTKTPTQAQCPPPNVCSTQARAASISLL